jgi:hypothetical protein
MFGEISAWLVRSSEPLVTPAIVLLGNNDWSLDPTFPDNSLYWVYYWKVPLAEPWGGDLTASALNPTETRTAGYGPYIIGEYSDGEYPGTGPSGDMVLWHTISVWQGPSSQTPYGVYTGDEVIPWP